MLGILRRLLRMEGDNLELKKDVKRLEGRVASLVAENEEVLQRRDGVVRAYGALLHEMKTPPCDPVRDALKAIVEDLGFCEWSTAEHAEEILAEMIAKHHSRASAALEMVEGA